MTLRDYLHWQQIRYVDFAQRVGVSEPQLQRYVGARSVPRPAIMRRILQESGGQVTPNDFYGVALGQADPEPHAQGGP